MVKNFTNNKENILECEFKNVKETLKNNHNYKEIQNTFNNLNTTLLIERDTNVLTLKKIEIEDLLSDLLIIKSLTAKLIKKQDYELDIQLKKLHTSFSNCQSNIPEASENNLALKKKCLVTNLEQANDAVCESKIRLDTFLRQYSNYKDRTQKIESILDRVRIMESDYKKMISNETGKSYEEIKSIVSDICDIT